MVFKGFKPTILLYQAEAMHQAETQTARRDHHRPHRVLHKHAPTKTETQKTRRQHPRPQPVHHNQAQQTTVPDQHRQQQSLIRIGWI